MKSVSHRFIWVSVRLMWLVVAELAFPVLSAVGRFSSWCRYFRWLLLSGVGMRRLDWGRLEVARCYARELLGDAQHHELDWNYGNAIHKGHTILGLADLREGDRDGAKHHLVRAGQTPGSPQLDTFGPNMRLAEELLQVGETEAVLEYLSVCAAFWDEEFGRDRLSCWSDAVRSGSIPKFGANLRY